jgi:DeoR/GlpR family transcriptional regulator of sugar metabolism
VSVAELSSLFNVSRVTIRNDLGELERQGLLVRTHGWRLAWSTTMMARRPTWWPRSKKLAWT